MKRLVFEQELKANERDHLQPEVEKHYWLFGEQYHLVTAAEPKFEEALRRFIYILRGQKKPVAINHPNKCGEMDIFMVRQLAGSDNVKSVVVELKSPSVSLGESQLGQVKRYMEVVLRQAEFNGNTLFWEFHLVGNRFDTSGYIERELKNAASHGENSLVYSVDNYKIYVRKWSDVFTEVDLRHRFLLEKLSIERSRLATEGDTANALLRHTELNTAIQPAQITVP